MNNKYTKKEMLYGVPHKSILDTVRDIKRNIKNINEGWKDAAEAWKEVAMFYKQRNMATHANTLERNYDVVIAKFKHLQGGSIQCFVDCYKGNKKEITGSGHSLSSAMADAYKQHVKVSSQYL